MRLPATIRRVLCPLLVTVLLLGGCAAGRGAGGVGGGGGSEGRAGLAGGPVLAMPPRLELPLQRRGGHVLLPTWINGRSAGLFMLDTGSSLTVVESGLVARLGLESVGGGTTVGIGGREAFTLRRIDDLAVAATPPMGVEVGGAVLARGGAVGIVLLRLPADPVAELNLMRVFRGLGGGVNGLIGFPAFEPMPFTLDLARDRMVLHDAARFDGEGLRRGGAVAFRLHRVRGLPAVAAVVVDAAGRRTPVLLVIDSGADNALTLPLPLLLADPSLAGPASAAGRSRGVGGEVSGTLGFLPRLRLLGRGLDDVEVSFEPAPEGFDRHALPVGRIGVKMLERMQLTFDAEREVLWARWNAE